MTRQFEAIPLSSRAVRVGATITLFGIGLLISAMVFVANGRKLGIISALLVSAAGGLSIWLELRKPRMILMTEEGCEFRRILRSEFVRDGELESIRPALLSILYPGATPSSVVLRFRGKRIKIKTSFRGYEQFLDELKIRNPQAQIAVPRAV